MRVLTGTVLPLVLVYVAVVVLLVAARRPAELISPRPLATLASIVAGGCVLFAAAMTTYCVAEPRDATRCVRQSLGEAGVLAAATALPAFVLTLVLSRRTRSGRGRSD